MSMSTLEKPTTRPYMPLEDALRYLRRNRVFLCYRHDGSVDLWTCSRKMPQSLRRSVFKHRQELAAMMREAHPKVCPARDLHAFEWVYFPGQGRYVCLMCQALAV